MDGYEEATNDLAGQYAEVNEKAGAKMAEGEVSARTGTACGECGGGFDEVEWEVRHTRDRDGEDVHARCCPTCYPKEVRDGRR